MDGNLLSADELLSIRPQIVAFHAATKGIPQRPGFLSSQDLIELDHGGDVDLRTMPAKVVARCRGLWSAVSEQTEAVIHGDINPGNLIRCSDGSIALIDWDECRRDLVLF
ncbi:phosphotransferase [Salipiger thiooxidans]|uniref:phosphotransferase n=1 Tax=Salipiger thiooxidans TaxID=282683 RepID=UPI001CD79BFB|nr:phosphotransferase [Salipiger thiooxidans]MCA0851454.1 phosphotransferase [Salipiger thiooxidans]